MNSATLVLTYKNEAGTAVITSSTAEADMTVNVERGSLAPGLTNLEIDCPIDVSAIKAFAIGCTKTANEGSKLAQKIYIQTNSTSSPDDGPWELTPTIGKGWIYTQSEANPFTTDVTKFYVTVDNAGDSPAKMDLNMRFLIDSTPNEVG